MEPRICTHGPAAGTRWWPGSWVAEMGETPVPPTTHRPSIRRPTSSMTRATWIGRDAAGAASHPSRRKASARFMARPVASCPPPTPVRPPITRAKRIAFRSTSCPRPALAALETFVTPPTSPAPTSRPASAPPASEPATIESAYPSGHVHEVTLDQSAGRPDVADAIVSGLALDHHLDPELAGDAEEGGPVDLARAGGDLVTPGAGHLGGHGILDVNLAHVGAEQAQGLHRIPVLVEDHVCRIEVHAHRRMVQLFQDLEQSGRRFLPGLEPQGNTVGRE